MADAASRRRQSTDRKANRRGAARLAAVQALYQMDIAGTGINDIFAEFESHWLGSEVEGETISAGRGRVLPRRRRPASCATRRKLDPLIDDGAVDGLAAEADRGDPARGAAGRGL